MTKGNNNELVVTADFTGLKDMVFSKAGEPLNLPLNYYLALKFDESLEGKIKYNSLNDRITVNGVPWHIEPHPIRDIDLFQIRQMLSMKYGLRNKDEIKQALQIVADENKTHPVQELLKSLAWDGESRLQELFPRYLGAERSEYTTAVTKVLFNGLIMRAFKPGIKYDMVVILADTKQGTGKSSMCRFLALNDDWFCDSLGDLGDPKSAYEAIRGHWVCELGEMIATRRTKDIESIKAYISRTGDDYRDPYGIYPERRPRQCVFIGTSNKPQFLPDDKTGNRRFLPLICDGNKAIVHPMQNENETREYIRQCYAEALTIGADEGWKLTLDKEFDSILSQIRGQSTPEDSLSGVVQEWLDNLDPSIDRVCSRMIWEGLNPDTNMKPTKFELQEISDIMNLSIEGWKKYKGANNNQKTKFTKYGSQRTWVRAVASEVGTGAQNAVNSGNDGFAGVEESDANNDVIPF